MSLTIKQQGNDYGVNLIPGSVNKKIYYTVLSSEAQDHISFMYNFKVYDTTGVIYETKKPPTENMLGVFNPQTIVKHYIENIIDASSSVETFRYMKEITIGVQEYWNGSLQGSEVMFEKSVYSNLLYNQTDSILPYNILNNTTQKFLTTMEDGYTYSQYIFTDASISYNINNIGTDYIYYYIKTNDGVDFYEYKYRKSITSTYEYDTATALHDTLSSTHRIPVGMKTINGTTLYKMGYTKNGTWHTSTGTQTGYMTNMESEITELKISNGTYNYKWKIRCGEKNEITLIWENVIGGTDFYNFTSYSTDKMVHNTENYIHNTNELNSSDKYVNDINKNNMDVYYSKTDYEFRVRTDYLMDHDIELLKGLYISDNIVMYKDGIKYPVLSLMKTKSLVDKKKPRMIIYESELKYSKII